MFEAAKTISPETATWIIGLLGANAFALISGIISIKVSIAKLEVKVDKLERDANGLGAKIRGMVTEP